MFWTTMFQDSFSCFFTSNFPFIPKLGDMMLVHTTNCIFLAFHTRADCAITFQFICINHKAKSIYTSSQNFVFAQSTSLCMCNLYSFMQNSRYWRLMHSKPVLPVPTYFIDAIDVIFKQQKLLPNFHGLNQNWRSSTLISLRYHYTTCQRMQTESSAISITQLRVKISSFQFIPRTMLDNISIFTFSINQHYRAFLKATTGKVTQKNSKRFLDWYKKSLKSLYDPFLSHFNILYWSNKARNHTPSFKAFFIALGCIFYI